MSCRFYVYWVWRRAQPLTTTSTPKTPSPQRPLHRIHSHLHSQPGVQKRPTAISSTQRPLYALHWKCIQLTDWGGATAPTNQPVSQSVGEALTILWYWVLVLMEFFSFPVFVFVFCFPGLNVVYWNFSSFLESWKIVFVCLVSILPEGNGRRTRRVDVIGDWVLNRLPLFPTFFLLLLFYRKSEWICSGLPLYGRCIYTASIIFRKFSFKINCFSQICLGIN